MAVADEFPNLDKLLNRLIKSFQTLKLELQDDGRLDVDEMVSAIPLEKGREEIRELLATIKGIYPEVGKLASQGPFRMLTTFGPYLAYKLMDIFE